MYVCVTPTHSAWKDNACVELEGRTVCHVQYTTFNVQFMTRKCAVKGLGSRQTRTEGPLCHGGEQKRGLARRPIRSGWDSHNCPHRIARPLLAQVGENAGQTRIRAAGRMTGAGRAIGFFSLFLVCAFISPLSPLRDGSSGSHDDSLVVHGWLRV